MPTDVDLRPRLRDHAEVLEQVATYLGKEDRILLFGVHQSNMTATAAGELIGLDAQQSQRRFRDIISRLTSHATVVLLTCLPELTDEAAAILVRTLIGGQTLRDCSRDSGYSLHRVRRIVADFRSHTNNPIFKTSTPTTAPEPPRPGGPSANRDHQ